MAMIEGLGDEVTYALMLLFVIFVLSLAWLSTGVRPFNYYVWLIQLQTLPQRRVIQVLHMDEQSAVQLERETSSDPSQATTRTWRVPTDDREISTEETSIITHLARFNDLQVEIEEMNPSDTSSVVAQPAVNGGDTSPETILADQTESVAECGPPASDKCETDFETEKVATQPSPPQPQPEPKGQPEQVEEAQPGDTRIKLKFLDDTQKMVGAWLSQTVGDFKREHFTPAVHEGKVVRLIYRGQLLRDDGRSLASYGLHDNCIVHCHVSTTPYQADNNSNNSDNSRVSAPASGTIGGGSQSGAEQGSHGRLHIGRYINVIFTLKFLALWLGAMLYPELFDFASFFSLFMCTVVYALFVFTNYRAREAAAQPRSNSPSATASNATAN
jgi:hypothetical protein